MLVKDLEIQNAIKELSCAENHFDWCDPEYIDTATFQLSAAKAKLSALIRNRKDSQDIRKVAV